MLKGKNPSTPNRNLRMRHAARQRKRLQAPLDSAAMLDKVPMRTPLGAQLIACPPKQQARPAGPCALVIFGATGDLTGRLVVPALPNPCRRPSSDLRSSRLTHDARIGYPPRVGVSRVEFIDENGGGPGVRLRKRQQKKGSHRE